MWQKESEGKSLPRTSREREGCQRLGECYNRITPGDIGNQEWCLTTIVWLIGIDNVSCEQGFTTTLCLGNEARKSSARLGFLGLSGLTSLLQQFHDCLMSVVGRALERCSAIGAWLVGIDIVPCE